MRNAITHDQFVASLPPNTVILLTQYVNAKTRIECECLDCGHIWMAYPCNLKKGSACYKCGRKSAFLKLRQNKIINDYGDHLEIDVSTKKFSDAIMKIDKDDWAYIQSLMGGRCYAVSLGSVRKMYSCLMINGKSNLVHRLLLRDSFMIDHENGNGLDNRRSNIRACNHSQNAINSSIRIDNTSGVVGVSFHKSKRMWCASISNNKKVIYLGSFAEKLDAVRARKEAEQEYYGEFAPSDR